MQKDTHTTDVIFRVDTTKDFKGVVFAIFPHEVCDNKGNVTTYQHVGQHSSGCYQTMVKKSRLATESESKDLLAELESIGYNVKVVKKRNYDKFLKSYRILN